MIARHLIVVDDLNLSIFFDLEQELSKKNSVTYTENPTSIGTPIADHMYKNFGTGTISGRIQNISLRGSKGYTSKDKIDRTIKLFEKAMNEGYTISIYTRHFSVTNVCIESVDCKIPSDSFNTIDLSLSFKKIIKADIKATKVKGYTPQNSSTQVLDQKETDIELLNRLTVEFEGSSNIKASRRPESYPNIIKKDKVQVYNPALNKYVDVIDSNNKKLASFDPSTNMRRYYDYRNWG